MAMHRLPGSAPPGSPGLRWDASDTLALAIGAFLQSREAVGATAATLRTYAADLGRFRQSSGVAHLDALIPEVLERYLTPLRERMKIISVHRHYRALRTFCRWCVHTGRLRVDPMAGLKMRAPRVLPRVPSDEDVGALLSACPDTPEGRRNRVLIALAADAGLRKEELRRVRIGDLDQATRVITVRGGKGAKDGVTFFGEATGSLLRAWLAVHPDPRPAAFVLVARQGTPLGPWAPALILCRLSRRAGLGRRISAHALRHYAATAVWRRSGDLELVRRLLRHETLAMALRYVAVTQLDIAMKFQRASPLDHILFKSAEAKPTAWSYGTIGALPGRRLKKTLPAGSKSRARLVLSRRATLLRSG